MLKVAQAAAGDKLLHLGQLQRPLAHLRGCHLLDDSPVVHHQVGVLVQVA